MRFTTRTLLAISSLSLAALSLPACENTAEDPAATNSTGNSTNPDEVIIPSGGGKVDDVRANIIPARTETCVGTVCTCLKMAVLGSLASAADENNTDAFTNWLNTSADGTVTVTSFPADTELTPEFLKGFDIILLANMTGWMVSPAEAANVKSWSENQGGGIISLTGFTSKPGETLIPNSLLAFTGVQYGETAWTAPDGGGAGIPVYHPAKPNVDVRSCIAMPAAITTPIKFTPQAENDEDYAKLTLGLSYTGAYIGWPVIPAATSRVLATDGSRPAAMAVAHQVMVGNTAKGRAFVFGDEWATLTATWQGATTNTDPNGVCGVPASTDASGATIPAYLLSVTNAYQTKQFWYDVINWVAPPNECGFVIRDENVITPFD